HKPSLDWIKTYLDMKDEAVVEANKKQAYFPEDAVILPNSNGTAPGAIISENDKILVILPGPPREMKPMFNNHVIKYLAGITGKVIKSKTLRLFGFGESLMAKKINNLIQNSTNPTVAPYAKDVDVTLRITAKGKDEDECNNLINPVYKEIKEVLGEYIYGEDENSLEAVVAEILCNKNLSIATVESCTGGLV
ncbi:competence/damage-inducible protein A, partial [Clostridium perfringens]|nr:competence/damage-inducible protein A [Clostridium perfringens]